MQGIMTFHHVLFLCAFFLIHAHMGVARTFDVWIDPDEVVALDVRPGWRDPSGQHFAAIELRLAKGWHTYWRLPGSTGIPPVLSWQRSDNLTGVHFHWPTPEIIRIDDGVILGYYDRLILPMELSPKRPDGPIWLRGKLDIGVCREVCVPITLRFRARLPVSDDIDSTIVDALSNQPERGQGEVFCRIQPIQSGFEVSAHLPISFQERLDDILVIDVINTPEVFMSGQAILQRSDGVLYTQAHLLHVDRRIFSLDRSKLRFTILGQTGAVEYLGCRAPL